MLRFCGSQLELQVDSVLERAADQPAVCSATDDEGHHWLIVAGHPAAKDEMSWICAPASERAVKLVEAGQALARDAVRHSETGWVEVVRVVEGHSVPDSRIPCSSLPR